MLCKYTTLPPLYPVSQPFMSRVSVHAVDVYEPPGYTPANGYDDLNPPAYTASGRLFSADASPPPSSRVRTTIAPSSPGTFQHPPVTHGPAA